MKLQRSLLIAVLLSAVCHVVPLRADEGMWLFSDPPRKLLKEKYNFEPSKEWLEHQRLSAVFFGGGSGSFVWPDGLVMSNLHVGVGAISRLSTPQRDLVRDGFYARRQEDELKCDALELRVLVDVEDVTGRVRAAAAKTSDPAQALELRRAEMNAIEKDSQERTGLKSEVVSLYRGGRYHLHRYKTYDDVRLVFAPEEDVAAFGGDVDNFEYPRYDLDVSFFRVYEDGRPAKTPHYLRWRSHPVEEGELTFIVGHPGHTQRQLSAAHLEHMRDRVLPEILEGIRRREVLFMAFSQRSAEHRRWAGGALRSSQNSRKAREGQLDGLQTPAAINAKRAEENALLKAAAKQPELERKLRAALDTIATTLKESEPYRLDLEMLEGGKAFQSGLFGFARTLLRLAEETAKPDDQRLREYRETNLESLRRGLFSEAPIYPELETAMLADSLALFLERKGFNDPLVRQVMGDLSPRRRAEELVRGTRLADPSERRRLAEGGLAAIAASNDPMIQLARLVDEPARRVRKLVEEQYGEPQTRAYEDLADVRRELLSGETYPDANGTLRFSFGKVLGYKSGGKRIPPSTDIGGLYRRAEEQDFHEPFNPPKSWLDHKAEINLDVPMNFISTNDIIGGNSGSPVVDRNGDVVGLVFDGNLASLVWDFVFAEEEGRAVSLHAAAIIEALRKVYDAGRLADELEGK